MGMSWTHSSTTRGSRQGSNRAVIPVIIGAIPKTGRIVEGPVSSEAYVIIKQNEYMRKFRNAGAIDPLRAKPLAELKIRPDRIFRKMENQGIFKPGRTPDTYYMDAAAAEEFIEARRRRAFYLLLLAVIVAAVLFFLGRR
jgi:hypothetical protein